MTTDATIQIEKDVPLPKRPVGSVPKYPFEGMEVGDSFFVPGVKNGTFSGSIAHQKYRRGWTFKTRAVEGGVRVWRTA